MKAAIIGAIGSILGNVINTQQVNKANQQLTEQTNAANVAMVREQNRAAALEAEKAYQRSLPTNQVANMMSAGMSRAGALNAINGGGSYTPAPVNVAQNEAPQMQGVDFSALANVGMAISAQKSQERMQKEQIKAQAKENAANRANAKEVAKMQLEGSKYSADKSAESSKYGADKNAKTAAERLEFDKSVHNFFKDNQNKLLSRQIEAYVESNKASRQQREHLEVLKPFLKDKAEEEVKLIKQQIQRAKDQSDIEYKEYLLDKIRTSISSKFGVRIDELRNSIDFWNQSRGTWAYTIGYPGSNDKLRELERVEKDFMDYLSEIEKLLDELDE